MRKLPLASSLLDRLADWNEYIQCHDNPGSDLNFGGAGYNGPTGAGIAVNVYKTGHLLYAQGLTGLDSTPDTRPGCPDLHECALG